MPDDPRLERIYEGIELVGSVGDPIARTMCIMSFVACLAGEEPTDAPMTASPVIRSFAIVVNDRMPPAARRHLKPFAPRIIGTNDGLDEARIKVLRRSLADDILPRMMDEKHSSPFAAKHPRGVLGRAWIGLLKGQLRLRTADLMDDAAYDHRTELGIALARVAGELISLYALEATADDEGWYWGRAIDLLDRLCSVGAEGRVAAVCPDRLAWLERILVAQGHIGGQSGGKPTFLPTLAAQFPRIVQAAGRGEFRHGAG